MTQRIRVTPAQVAAAQLQIELAGELGETVSPVVRAIADAPTVFDNTTFEIFMPDPDVKNLHVLTSPARGPRSKIHSRPFIRRTAARGPS